MAYSRYTNIGDGVTTQVAISFPLGFINRSDVTIRVGSEVDGLLMPVYRTLTWINDGLVNIEGGAPGLGVPYTVERTVNKIQLTHDYSNGAPIIEQNLDQSNLQNLMAVHEALDGRFGAMQQDIDFNSFGGINARDPANPQDVATKAYVDQVAVLPSGNVPPPTLGNVGMFLKATATGVWAWASIAISDVVGAAKASIAQVRAGTTDDYLVTPLKLATFIKQGSDILSAATLAKPADANLGAVHRVTGSATTNSMWAGVIGGEPVDLWYTGAPLLTTAGNMLPPNGVAFQTKADDKIRWRWDASVSKWRVHGGVRGDGTALVQSGLGINHVINGDMEVAQRGTSFAAIANNAFAVDRWRHRHSGAMVQTATQNSDVPVGKSFKYSLRAAVTTADVAIAAGDFAAIETRIEGYDIRDLVGQDFVVSFEVRSSKSGVHCVSVTNSGADRSYVAEFTITTPDTWETKSITVPSGLITAGTWNYTSGIGLALRFALAAGTTFQTTANAWQTGDFLATASQANCMGTIGNIFAITGVKLERGGTPTAFEQRPFSEKLARCQRYFEKSFNYAVAPAQNTGFVGALGALQCVGASVSNQATHSHVFTVRKRAVPTVTTYNPGAANAQMRNGSLSADCSASGIATASGEVTLLVNYTTAAGSSAGQLNFVHWTADAEL